MYSFKQDGDNYIFFKGENELLTPGGAAVTTNHQPLAVRLLEDLDKYGEEWTSALSMVTFHYQMIDIFSKSSRAQIEHLLLTAMDRNNDWTFDCPSKIPEIILEWVSIFGTHADNYAQTKEWFPTLNIMQLTAICVIESTLESVNIPFVVATKIQPQNMPKFINQVYFQFPYGSREEIKQYLDNFLFYFNLEK